ncbi:MAG: M48 family metallopeptidase [Candidatus Omnitrophica bacterium]|nr:M48 family metallopeptidase [Candidatus Omnitrophota bacterium]
MIPNRVSLKDAKKFVNQKIGWIRKNLDKLNFLKEKHRNILKDVSDLTNRQQKLQLKARTLTIAEKYGFNYKNISIRNQKTRWGSCTKDNKINLNIKLLRLPDDLIDYVILHELLHTHIKNHSKFFKSELNSLVGNQRRSLNARLKSYHIGFIE